MPGDYIAQIQHAIVGLEIVVEAVQAKWKMSQNRSVADRAGVAAGLESIATDASRDAAAMVRAD